MDAGGFLALLKYARAHSSLGLRPDYWRGFQRGLRRGFHGEIFGTDGEHELWLRLADDGDDEETRDRGRGYRDGLRACAIADDGPLLTESKLGVPQDCDHRANSY